jgi:hypothetical protein
LTTRCAGPFLEIVAALKRLKLGRIAEMRPERLVLADEQEMSFDKVSGIHW